MNSGNLLHLTVFEEDSQFPVFFGSGLSSGFFVKQLLFYDQFWKDLIGTSCACVTSGPTNFLKLHEIL